MANRANEASKIYIVVMQGVYMQGILGVYSTQELAKMQAQITAAEDIDSYHNYNGYEITLDETSVLTLDAFQYSAVPARPRLFSFNKSNALKS